MNIKDYNFNQLAENIKLWSKELGFSLVGITNSDDKRIISCGINYFPACNNATHISRYAVGRNYHIVVRKKLKKLVKKITEEIGVFNHKHAVDSSLVAEKPLAVQAGLGWQGKNSLVINRKYGSWMFLGEIVIDLPLPIDKPHKNHCGKCIKCINACPTGAITKPFQLDISRCISFLTIEYRGSIPENLRPLIGRRIFGCDECQLACPWNRFAKLSLETDFHARHNLDKADLITLFSWSEEEFLANTIGSVIRRVSYECWLRNIAVALGNSKKDSKIIAALQTRLNHPSALVREHIEWALNNYK